MIKDEILFSHKYDRIKHICFSCKEKDHNLKRCPLITYQPNKSFIILKHNFSKPQKRQWFERKYHIYRSLIEKKMTFKAALTMRFDKEIMNSYKISINSPSLKEFSEDNIESQYSSQRSLSEGNKIFQKALTFNPYKEEINKFGEMKRSKSMNTSSSESISLIYYPSHEMKISQSISNFKDRKKSISGENLAKGFNQSFSFPEPKQIDSKQIDFKKEEKNNQFNSGNSLEILDSPGILKLKACKKSDEGFQNDSKRNSLLSPLKKEKEEEKMQKMSLEKLEPEKSEKVLTPRNNKSKRCSFKKSSLFALRPLRTMRRFDESLSDYENPRKTREQERNLFWNEFERMKIFKNYFEHNNTVNVILARSDQKRRKMTLKSKMTTSSSKHRSKVSQSLSPHKTSGDVKSDKKILVSKF